MAAPAEPWLCVAEIVRPHGIRGELVAELRTDFPERFQPGILLQLRAPQAAAPTRAVVLTGARLHAGRMLLCLEGCASRDTAEALRGWELLIDWQQRMAVDEDSIYLADLLGAVLVDRASGAEAGIITGVDRESSSMDLLVVTSEDHTERLVPFARAYAPEWDGAARRLSLTLPEGLLTLG